MPRVGAAPSSPTDPSRMGCSSGAPLREEQWIYEGLGRIHQERRLAKDGQYDDRLSRYDVAGHRDYLGEWQRGGTTASLRLEWGDFDPFGRPGKISRFSNNAFLRDEAVMTYVGESKSRERSGLQRVRRAVLQSKKPCSASNPSMSMAACRRSRSFRAGGRPSRRLTR